MRGRNNNNSGGGGNNNNNQNRKGPNPLTRNYESNGPDVKIRGSAQQVADKYTQLARDSHSSGDRVMAENYLQHAEHYNRIIAAAQAQMPIQQQNNRDESDDDMDEDRDDFDNNQGNAGQGNVVQGNASNGNANNGNGNNGNGNFQQNNGGGDRPQPAVNHGTGPQPIIEGMPAEVALNSEPAGEGGRGERIVRASNNPNNSTNGPDDESGEQPRRGRRPRRGERARPERDLEADSSEGLAQTLSRGAAFEKAAPEPVAAEPAGNDADVETADR
jgi:hypothetical protein